MIILTCFNSQFPTVSFRIWTYKFKTVNFPFKPLTLFLCCAKVSVCLSYRSLQKNLLAWINFIRQLPHNENRHTLHRTRKPTHFFHPLKKCKRETLLQIIRAQYKISSRSHGRLILVGTFQIQPKLILNEFDTTKKIRNLYHNV